MFILHIESISPSGWKLKKKADAESLPLLHALTRETPIGFVRPVEVDIHAHAMGEQVAVRGGVKTMVRLTCSRCLTPFERELETDFSATAVPARPSATDPDLSAEIELSAEEIDVIPYEGDSIDLRDEIAQQIIMSLPFKPLCMETCRGLCSGCGVNLNQAACNCPPDETNSPFAVLKSLAFTKDNDKE